MDLATLVANKKGLEIGGTSYLFKDAGIYAAVNSLDNVIFSLNTVWAQFSDKTYEYLPGKIGKLFEMDAVNLSGMEDQSYDFILSSHNLEHIANPLRALKEWIRVLKSGGHIILILPDKNHCFDHRRSYTTFETIYDKWYRKVEEDNLESLPEILRLHDLNHDRAAGTFEQFTKRSLDNYQNRCLHHHVFSLDLIEKIVIFLNLKLIFHQSHGLNMWFVLQKI